MLLTAQDLMTLHVEALDGRLGKIKDVYLDDRDWHVRYLVVDTGTWLPGRRVLIGPDSVTHIDPENGLAYVSLSKDQVKAAPSTSEHEPVSRQFESRLAQYYGWTPYWSATAVPLAYPALAYPFGTTTGEAIPESARELLAARTEPDGSCLRSARELHGYQIAATDDQFGEVDDLLVDTAQWTMLAFVLASRRWLPGGRIVLCPPLFVDSVSFATGTLAVRLSKRTLLEAPEINLKDHDATELAALVRYFLGRLQMTHGRSAS